VTLTLPEGDSHVRRTDIVLPLGTTLSPGVADGLQACTQAQFEWRHYVVELRRALMLASPR